MKELLQANVTNIFYLGDFPTYNDAGLNKQLADLVERFRKTGGKTRKLVVPGIDPNLSAESAA